MHGEPVRVCHWAGCRDWLATLMRQLLQGVRAFHEAVRSDESLRGSYQRLAAGQRPDMLYVGCSDSRVVPHLLSTAEPGDLFVVRNVGNMIPPASARGVSIGDRSEAAVLEYAILHLKVRDVVLCGHSSCGAMAALHDGIDGATNPNLAEWLRLGMPALDEACFPPSVGEERTPRDATSQRNVLQQLRHVRTYPFVAEALDAGRLRLHGWWFDIEEPVVRAFHESSQRFLPIELAYAQSDFG